MGLKYYFLSDAHLGSRMTAPDIREEKLIRFCSRIAGAEALFLLGDIFDFWFEYRRVVPSAHFNVLHNLRKLAATGTALYYIRGNHDLWRGKYLTETIGMEILSRPATFKISGLRVHLCHGDGFLKGDVTYPIHRFIMHNPISVFLYRLVHPDFGIPFAMWMSRQSRKSMEKHTNRETVMASYRERAADVLKTAGYDALIAAHTHYADIRDFDGRLYINTGNWLTDFDYLLLEDGKFSLKKFKGENE